MVRLTEEKSSLSNVSRFVFIFPVGTWVILGIVMKIMKK